MPISLKPRVAVDLLRIDRDLQVVTAGVNFEDISASIKSEGSEVYDYAIFVSLHSLGEIRMTTENLTSYSKDYMRGRSSSASANTTASQAYIKVCEVDNVTYPSLAEIRVTGYIGNKRHISVFQSFHDGSTAVQIASYYTADTATELKSFQFYSPVNDTLTYTIVGVAVPKIQYNPKAILLKHKVLTAHTADIIFGGVNDTEGVDDLDGDLWDYVVNSSDLTTEITGSLNEITNVNNNAQQIVNANGAISSVNFSNPVHFDMTGDSFVEIKHNVGSKPLITRTRNKQSNNQQKETVVWNPNTSTPLSSLLLRPVSSTSGTVQLYAVPKGYNGDLIPWRDQEIVNIAGDFSAGHSFNIPSDALFARIQIVGDSASGSNIEIDFDTTTSVQRQFLKSSGSGTSASFSTNRTIGRVQKVSVIDCIVSLKSGANRPMLSKSSYNENTIDINGLWGLDSATNYNQIILNADNANVMNAKITVSFF